MDLQKILNDYKNKTLFSKLKSEENHAQERHVNLSDKEKLERVLKDDLTVSSFENQHDYEECLIESLITNEKIINDHFNNPKVKNFDRIIVDTIFDDELYQGDDPVDFQTNNKAIMLQKNGHIKEVTTNATRLILEKNDYSPYGINLITFYPDAKNNKATIKPTKKNLLPTLKSTTYYKDSETLVKAGLEETLTNNNSFIKVSKPNRYPCVEIKRTDDKIINNVVILDKTTNYMKGRIQVRDQNTIDYFKSHDKSYKIIDNVNKRNCELKRLEYEKKQSKLQHNTLQKEIEHDNLEL